LTDVTPTKFQLDLRAFNADGEEIGMKGVDFDPESREQAIYALRFAIMEEWGINILPGSIY
jgi:beta-galactosidase GanA